jgi:hypothetical protein
MIPNWTPSIENWPDLTKTEVGDKLIYCLTCNEQWILGKEGSVGITYCNRCKQGMRWWHVLPGEKERQKLYMVCNHDKKYYISKDVCLKCELLLVKADRDYKASLYKKEIDKLNEKIAKKDKR